MLEARRGATGPSPSGAEWTTRIIETNLTGTFHRLQAIAGAMGPQGGGSDLPRGRPSQPLQGGAGKRRMQPRKPASIGLVRKRGAEEWRIKRFASTRSTLKEGDEARRKAMPAEGAFSDHRGRGRPRDLDEVAQAIRSLAQLTGTSRLAKTCVLG
ncbi:MAG: hypothetical protein U0231_16560 [Nitrospiraceae bacterium]